MTRLNLFQESSLPNSVGKLIHLETLDLKYTRVFDVPVDIIKLTNLRNLLIDVPEMEYYSG
ncbi:hypothetical protein FRX31_022939, partial [Thalictrum thalictroides]